MDIHVIMLYNKINVRFHITPLLYSIYYTHGAIVVYHCLYACARIIMCNVLECSVFVPADTYEWSQPEVSGTSPGAVAAHSCVAIGNKIYFFGGLCAADEKELASRSLHFLDTGEQQTPSLGTCSVMPFYPGFYLMGGAGGMLLPQISTFSPKTL